MISIVCKTLNHSYWKSRVTLVLSWGLQYAQEGEGQRVTTDAPSHSYENERQSEPEAIFSEDIGIGQLVTASSLARCYAFWRAKSKTWHLKCLQDHFTRAGASTAILWCFLLASLRLLMSSTQHGLCKKQYWRKRVLLDAKTVSEHNSPYWIFKLLPKGRAL